MKNKNNAGVRVRARARGCGCVGGTPVLLGSADTDVSFSVKDLGSQRMDQTLRPHSLLRNPMNITNTTHGILCWNFCVIRI